MEVLVDDKPYQPTGSPDQAVHELANEVCSDKARNGNRMVVALSCNGQPVAQENLDNVLRTPASQFDRLELHTQPVSALVRATLDQAIELFQDSTPTRHQIADMLAAGQHEPAMNQLQQFLAIWKQVQQSLILSVQTLGLDLDSLRANDLTVSQILDLIKPQLSELKQAMQQGDFVVVGDILRYELDEPCEHWNALLHHIRSQAATT